ncbi:hypothetical protein JTB14_004191 [Gonioctena quinquepunctata]|nr:hypothetical protein JTB14_004191 [Gonioctena quinquepunctata]
MTLEKQGGQTVLAKAEERSIIEKWLTCSEWGYALDTFDLRLVIQKYLNRTGRVVSRFKENLPGEEFVYSFLKWHSRILSERMCQNIKRARAGVTRTTITEYFEHLSAELESIPASNVNNYDETNLCNDPGRKKIIAKREFKYPERIMNHSESSTSIMFAASGSWRTNSLLCGLQSAEYVRLLDPSYQVQSGWFDSNCFEYWVHSIAIPYLRKLPGKKILIGDN